MTLTRAAANSDLFESLDTDQIEFINKTLKDKCGVSFREAYRAGEPFDPTPIAKGMVSILASSGYNLSASWQTGWAAPKEGNAASQEGQFDHYVAAVKGLDLIDIEAVPWETIVELRRDKDAMAELRNFRLFVADMLKENDKEYIKDRILQLHDKQKEVAKLWGMKTAQRSISVAFDKYTLGGASAVSAALGLLGGPISAAAALIIPAGRVALEFYKARIDAREAMLDKPLQYLTRLEGLGSGSSERFERQNT
jgi:hypothetical protein